MTDIDKYVELQFLPMAGDVIGVTRKGVLKKYNPRTKKGRVAFRQRSGKKGLLVDTAYSGRIEKIGPREYRIVKHDWGDAQMINSNFLIDTRKKFGKPIHLPPKQSFGRSLLGKGIKGD